MSSLADIRWSDADLEKLANGNYKKTASSIVLSGVPTVDIMPFGISDNPSSVVIPVLPEAQGFEEEKAEGEFAFDEFLPDTDDLVERMFDDDALVEREPVAFPRFGDGYEINYANIRRAGRFSFGINRKEFFYAQLDRMLPSFVTNEDTYSSYQLAATFTTTAELNQYGAAVPRNFGTTAPDGERRRVPHDDDVWEFDIHDPLNVQVDRPNGATIVTGDVVHFSSFNAAFSDDGVQGIFDSVMKDLKTSLDAKMPQDSDSGGAAGAFANAQRHMMNLFLYKIRRPNRRAGGAGAGLYDISKSTSNSASFSQKSVFSPKVKSSNTCFWECLAYHLYLRYYEDETYSGVWYEEFVKGWVAKGKSVSKNRMNTVKALISRQAGMFRMEYYSMYKKPLVTGKVLLDDIPIILSGFDMVTDPVILNEDGEALIGDTVEVEKRRNENGDFTALWIDDHLHLILSYTGSLVVKKCRRCDVRFSSQGALEKHLESKKCMTCVCKENKETFDDEKEWLEHMRTREQSCPKYRLCISETSMESNSSDNARQIRFLNDKHPNKYRDAKKAQDAFDRDHTPMRNRKECIYFDLESVVPMNSPGVSEFEQEKQMPYAAGWILRSDALKGEEVTISYGPQCIKDFVDYLDRLYAEILLDEERLWIRRANEGTAADPIPRKNRGFENFSFRVKSSWDRYYLNRESDGCLICNEPMDASHGYTCGDNNFHTFSSCAILVYARNVAEVNLEKNFNDNAPRIPIWAHNGGKYDWVFLHRYLIENGKLDELETVRSSSKYFQLSYRNVFEFKDSLNFMMGSLDKLGKDFGVETLKGIFPYRLLDSLDKIHSVLHGEGMIREKIPHEFLQVPEKLKGPMGLSVKRALSEEEYSDFFKERDWIYDVKSETIKYLRDDVMCLFGVIEKFREGWYNMPHSPELFSYCTIGQMCHSYFLEHYLEADKYPCLDVCEDRYIRRALYGGRTEVFQRKAPEGSTIHYVDVNSLYPYVMESRDLPCGDPIWHFRVDDPQMFEFANSKLPVMTRIENEVYFEDLMRRLNEGENTKDIYGFLEVDVQCPLTGLYPVLPERRSMDGGKTFKNMFTNMSKKKMVYYSEELKRGIANGCVITKVWSFTQWQRGRVYGKLIRVLKEQKLLGEGKDVEGNRIEGVPKNPSLRAAAKTAQNSLFGKTIQFIDSHVQLVHTRERLFKLIDSPFSKVSIKPTFRSNVSDVVEVTTKFEIPKIQRRSCAALGTAILAEARLVLYDYFEKVQEVGGTILYCDTDSIVFAGDNPLGDECMDDSAYGKMKVEIDPKTIRPGGFVGMSPKCYAFNLEDDLPYVRFKGVVLSENISLPSEGRDGISDLLEEMECEEIIEKLALPIRKEEVVARGVSFDLMKKLIDGEVDALMTQQMQFRKTTSRMVSACEVVKVARSNFDKRMLGKDGATFAWNDFNMNMDEIITRGDVTALSDYLGHVMLEELEVLKERYKDNSFFMSIFNSWLDSDNVNAILYNYEHLESSIFDVC